VRAQLAELLRPAGLTPAQGEVLVVVQEAGRPLTVREIGERLVCEGGSPSRLVASLVDAGLLQRGDHPADRRAVELSLTVRGVAAAQEVRGAEAPCTTGSPARSPTATSLPPSAPCASSSAVGPPATRSLAAEAARISKDRPEAPLYDRPMCRVLAYLGEPIPLAHVLFETDSSLVRQSHSPRMMETFLNLAGFGMVGVGPRSVRAEEPFTYRTTTLPDFDRNLRSLSGKLAPTCLVAHVRGVADGEQRGVARPTCTRSACPARGVALAHNGHLREFARMRYDLIGHIRPELAQRIAGTTDSEWIYAMVLSQLEDPYGEPDARELADAVTATLRRLREVRARHGIDTSSPVNLFLATGRSLVATRFSFDYGWYPDEDALLETDLPYCSLWYTVGGVRAARTTAPPRWRRATRCARC
jgi:glutamine amidotransferase